MTDACACVEAARARVARGSGVVAIVVAGGSGERFGDARGKQYVDLCGLPMLGWSLVAFDRSPSVSAIVVVCPAGRVEETERSVLGRLKLRTPVVLAEAGATRQASVAAGLEAADALAARRGAPFELVSVHDGARPLVATRTIEAVIAAVRDDAALAGAVAAARATDTLKLVEDDLVVATPDRSYYWTAMTPQTFRTEALRAAHAAAAVDGFVGTDDASLVERWGGRVRCVDTPRDNIKVTVPEDLAVAEALLRARLATEGTFAGCDEA